MFEIVKCGVAISADFAGRNNANPQHCIKHAATARQQAVDLVSGTALAAGNALENAGKAGG